MKLYRKLWLTWLLLTYLVDAFHIRSLYAVCSSISSNSLEYQIRLPNLLKLSLALQSYLRCVSCSHWRWKETWVLLDMLVWPLSVLCCILVLFCLLNCLSFIVSSGHYKKTLYLCLELILTSFPAQPWLSLLTHVRSSCFPSILSFKTLKSEESSK